MHVHAADNKERDDKGDKDQIVHTIFIFQQHNALASDSWVIKTNPEVVKILLKGWDEQWWDEQ